MSQITELPSPRGVSSVESDFPGSKSAQNFDIVKIIWRWKWLPVLGAIIGAGTGFMFFSKLPKQFVSQALVQVVYAMPANLGADLYDPEKIAFFSNRNDESRAIKSVAVLSLAVKDGKLQKHFGEMGVDQIVAELRDLEDGISVKPADKSERSPTQQVFISYRCPDPVVAHAVVDAVVKGYQSFLAAEYKTVDTEVLKFFANTEKRISKSYQDLYEQHQKFREEAPNVLWTGDDAIDPFAESYLRLKVQLEDIKAKRTTLRGTLQQVIEAQKANRQPEDILVMLQEGSQFVHETLWREVNDSEATTQVLESEKLENNMMIPLRAKEQQLLASYGPSHPSVQTIRREIATMEEAISAIREMEKSKEFEKERKLSRALTKTPPPGLENMNSQLASVPTAIPNAKAESNADAGSSSDLSHDLESSQEDVNEMLAARWLDIQINGLKEQYRAMERHEADFEILANEQLAKSQELQVFLSRNRWLKDQLESVKEMLESFTEKVRQVELTPTNANQRVLKELDPAALGSPDGPYATSYIGGGAMAGILFMCGLALLMDMADRSYRSPDEIVSDLGRPILGHIPAMDLGKLKRVVDSVDSSVITVHHSRGRIAEAFRSVRTSLFFSSRASELKVIQITSPVPGDGKSTMSANLAVTMAQSGRRVVLIDADLRRPRQHKLFGVEGESGIAQVLSGKAELDDATYTTNVANLWLIPGGTHPRNPSELLSSDRFSELIEVLREKYDMIILDTPPVLAVSDPCAVSAVADGVVIAMRLRRNIKPLATRTISLLDSVDAQVLGVVVNGVSTEAAYGGYGYSYNSSDYRDSYRYEGPRYSYGKYGQYTAGYIEESQILEDSVLAEDPRSAS